MVAWRQKIAIFLLVLFCIVVFSYAIREILFQNVKNLIKQNLENSLPCKLVIGKIRAGLLYGLVLEGVKITFPQSFFGLSLNIAVDESYINYNLWQNALMRQQKEVQHLRLISPTISLSSGPKLLQENVKFSSARGLKTTFPLHGFVLSLEDGQISFGNQHPAIRDLQGEILLSQQGLYFRDVKASLKDNAPNVLKVYGELSEERLCLTANLEHLKVKDFDILTNLVLDLNRRINLQDGAPKVGGTFKTYGSVLNNQPIPELNSAFEMHGDKLRILGFSLGDNYNLRGIVNLSPPWNADLSLNFYEAELTELISWFSRPLKTGKDRLSVEQKADFSGLVNGLIKITGELTQPQVEGYLEARDGHIGDLYFVSADMNVKGRYPRISITDSRVFREEDSFVMEGEIDFTDLERQDFLELSFLPDKGMFWQGWDITRKRQDQLHMSKGVADDLKVTFDTFMEEDRIDYEDNYTNELGLEYKIFGDKLIKLRLRREEGILGLERRMKF